MNTSDIEIPPGLRKLYDAGGPVIRYRVVRDLMDQDDSFVRTAQLGQDLLKLPEVRALLAAQQIDGAWGGALHTAGGELFVATQDALLRLCELGQQDGAAVTACLEKALLPSLLHAEILWEYSAPDAPAAVAARQIVRDAVLRLIVRATRQHDDLIKPLLELLLTEWERYLAAGQTARGLVIAPPTADGYAAVCTFPWPDDDFPRVRNRVVTLLRHLETLIGKPPRVHPLLMPRLLRLADKAEYLSRPDLLLYELELSARLGVTHAAPVTCWLLEELEARQDADGWVRFDLFEPLRAWWYFPLEKTDAAEFPVEWTFRALQIFKLLEYDF